MDNGHLTAYQFVYQLNLYPLHSKWYYSVYHKLNQNTHIQFIQTLFELIYFTTPLDYYLYNIISLPSGRMTLRIVSLSTHVLQGDFQWVIMTFQEVGHVRLCDILVYVMDVWVYASEFRPTQHIILYWYW